MKIVRHAIAGRGLARARWVSLLTAVCIALMAGAAVAAGSARFDGSPGTGAPPKRLDGRRMKIFKRDGRRNGAPVDSVTGPTGHIRFSRTVFHFRVKNARNHWRTWSNHYHGDVYLVLGSVTLTLPPHTTAFYFYAEPNDHRGRPYQVTATTKGASSGPLKVHGERGARFFGFVAKRRAPLRTITVSSNDRRSSATDPGGVAIGEFGIHKS